jgi:hypothetical protein
MKPINRFIKELLPEPEGPITNIFSPISILKLKFLIILTSP